MGENIYFKNHQFPNHSFKVIIINLTYWVLLLNNFSVREWLFLMVSFSDSGSEAHLVPIAYHSRITDMPFPSFLPDSLWFFLYSLGGRRTILLAFRSFSARVTPYVAVVLMCLLGGGELRVFLHCHLAPSYNIFYFWKKLGPAFTNMSPLT